MGVSVGGFSVGGTGYNETPKGRETVYLCLGTVWGSVFGVFSVLRDGLKDVGESAPQACI